MPTITLRKKDGTEAEVSATVVQAPPGLHGNHAYTPRQIDLAANINPANGLPYAQVVTPPKGGQISPPPSKNFR